MDPMPDPSKKRVKQEKSRKQNKKGVFENSETEILSTFSSGESRKSGTTESKQHYCTTYGVLAAVLFFITTCISVFVLFSTDRCNSISTLSADGIVDNFLSSNFSSTCSYLHKHPHPESMASQELLLLAHACILAKEEASNTTLITSSNHSTFPLFTNLVELCDPEFVSSFNSSIRKTFQIACEEFKTSKPETIEIQRDEEETIEIQRDEVCGECIQRTNTYLESQLQLSTKSCGLDILRGLNLHICPDNHFLHLQDGEGHFRLVKCGDLFHSVSLIGYLMTSDIKYPLSIYERKEYYDIHFKVFDSGTYSFKIMAMWVNGTYDQNSKNAHLYLGGQELHGGDMDALCQNLSYIHMGPIEISVPVRAPPLKFSGEKCKGDEEGRWRRFDESTMTTTQEWIYYKDEGPWEWVPFTCTYQKYINHLNASEPRIIFVGDSHIDALHSIFEDLGFTNNLMQYCAHTCDLHFLQQVTNNDIIISNLGIIHHVWHQTMKDAYNDLNSLVSSLNYPKKVFFEPWIQTRQREPFITYYRCRQMIEDLIPSLRKDGWKIFNTTKIALPRFEVSRDGCHFYSKNDKRGSVGKTVANNLVHYLKYLKYL